MSRRGIAMVVALSALSARAQFTPGLWPLSTNLSVYTNAIANDLLTNVLVRDACLWRTNWMETNVVSVWYGTTNGMPLTTNVVVTNWYGRFVQDGYTGVVRTGAASLERVNDRLETLFPYFSLPYYSDAPDNCFDEWFRTPTNNAPSAFPVTTKPDLFHKVGLGGLLVSNAGQPVLTFAEHLGAATNTWGQVTNTTAYWTKRRNRLNGTIVAQWGPEVGTAGLWGWRAPLYNLNTYPPMISDVEWMGWSAPANEFHSDPYMGGLVSGQYETNPAWGNSRLIDVGTTNYPRFRWLPSGTNACSSLTLRISVNWYDEGGLPGCYYMSNQLWNAIYLLQPPSFFLDDQTFSTATTTATRAWIALRSELLGPPANSNDHVRLAWEHPISTYEAATAWDTVLFPEAFNERWAAETNLFLVPWGQWAWTNTMYGTNYYHMDRTNGIFADPYIYENFETNVGFYAEPGDLWPAWWLQTEDSCLWVDQNTLPDMACPDLYETNGYPPSFTWSIANVLDIVEHAHEELRCPEFEPPPFCDVEGWRSATGNVTVTGESMSSRILVTNLWTGREKRAHFYTIGNYDSVSMTWTNRYFHRAELSDWTWSNSILSATRFSAFDDLLFTNPPPECGSGIYGSQIDTCCESGSFTTNMPIYEYYNWCEQILTNSVLDVTILTNSTQIGGLCFLEEYTTISNLTRWYEYNSATNSSVVTQIVGYANLTVWTNSCDTNAFIGYTTNEWIDVCPTATNLVATNWWAVTQRWDTCTNWLWDATDAWYYNETNYIEGVATSFVQRVTPYAVHTNQYLYDPWMTNRTWDASYKNNWATSGVNGVNALVLIEWRY